MKHARWRVVVPFVRPGEGDGGGGRVGYSARSDGGSLDGLVQWKQQQRR